MTWRRGDLRDELVWELDRHGMTFAVPSPTLVTSVTRVTAGQPPWLPTLPTPCVAAELGEAGEAIRLAADVDPSRLPTGLASRRAQLSLDIAWAQVQRKRDGEATLHLPEAERIAPETLRHNIIAHELIREMLTRGTKSKTHALSDLAVRAGVLH